MWYNLNGNALWLLVIQSDFITKLVLLTLLCMSIICWTIFLYKVILLRLKKRQLSMMLERLREVQTFEEMRMVASAMIDTLPGYFLKRNLIILKSLLEHDAAKTHLTQQECSYLRQQLEETLEDLMRTEESYLPFLFTSASVSPLLGLFGTVWGLVHAFIRISEKQSADIATVAPGIAEALITTLAGLLVAVPALVMYHFLIAQIRIVEHELYKVADKFHWIVQKIFIRKELLKGD